MKKKPHRYWLIIHYSVQMWQKSFKNRILFCSILVHTSNIYVHIIWLDRIICWMPLKPTQNASFVHSSTKQKHNIRRVHKSFQKGLNSTTMRRRYVYSKMLCLFQNVLSLKEMWLGVRKRERESDNLLYKHTKLC